MWNTILFDLDGTLTDSGEGIMKSFAYAVEKGFGIHVEDYHTLKKYIGQPLAESFQEYASLSEEQAREAVRLYRERYIPIGIYENRPYEGIADLLAELRSHGLVLAVASSKPTVMCEEVLRHFGLRQHFALVVGSELDGRRTHKDDVIKEILRILGKEDHKDEVVLVGDSPFDVKGAKEVGIDALSVAYGYGEREELEELWPACIVDSVTELRNVLVGQALYGIPSSENALAASASAAAAVIPQALHADRTPTGWRGQPYYPQGSYPVPNGPVTWPYARDPRYSPPQFAEEDRGSRWYGYRKSRDGHPFLAFWKIVWPPLAAFFIMELVGLIFGVFLTIWGMTSLGVSGNPESLENLIYSYTAQITIAADALAFILVFFLFRADERKRKHFHWKDRILKKPSNWLIGLAAAVLVGMLGCIFFNWLLSIFNVGALDPVYEEMEEKIMTLSDPAIMIIGTVIVAPIFEDMLFRGVLYRRLRDYLNVPLAVIISAAAFGIFHGNIIQFIYAAALGLLFALLYEHYGTVFVPILCHLGANMTSEILNYIAPELWTRGIEPIVTLILSGLLLTVLMLFILRKKNRVNKV